jgi:hypothetical protein
VTIQVKLLNILVRKKSHSRFVKSYEGQLNDITGFIDVYTNTLSRISCADEEKQRYAKIVKIEYAKGKAQLALHFGKYEDAKKFVEEIKELGGTISNNLRIKLFLSHFPIILKASIWLSGIIRTYLFCCFFI